VQKPQVREGAGRRDWTNMEIIRDWGEKGSETVPLGVCGDAWGLSACGGELDMIDHRPYAGNLPTPVGVCMDAPVLVLYPERGAVDWPQVLGHTLRKGVLLSGDEIWVVYLRDQDWSSLMEEAERMQVTKDHITEWLAHDADGFAQCRARYQAHIRNESTRP